MGRCVRLLCQEPGIVIVEDDCQGALYPLKNVVRAASCALLPKSHLVKHSGRHHGRCVLEGLHGALDQAHIFGRSPEPEKS